jgi:site-specific recombinase XerD
MNDLVPYKPKFEVIELSSSEKVSSYLSSLVMLTRGEAKGELVSALVPWVCNRLRSEGSRGVYLQDLGSFFTHMGAQGIAPEAVTADEVALYAEALGQSGERASTISRKLSAIRGAYRQFGKKGLVDWKTVGDIQAVESPTVMKNITPALSQAEAVRLLHVPDKGTMAGLRDHAMLFVFFKTACRVSAVVHAKVGDLERTDTEYYLHVREKGKKEARKALLEAAPAVLAYMDAGGIQEDEAGPLFRPVAKDRKTLLRKPLRREIVCDIVKRYAGEAGIQVKRGGGRAVTVHSLRKTALTNALRNGAPIEKVQQLAGHSDIRTTQLYYEAGAKDSEDAARHIQIR